MSRAVLCPNGDQVSETVYVVPIPGEQFGELGAGHSVTSFAVI